MVRIVNTEEIEQGLMLQYYETSQNWVEKEVPFFQGTVLSVHAYIDLLILFIVLFTPAFGDETVCIIYTKTSSVSFAAQTI